MRDILKRFSKMVVGYGAIQWAGPLLSFLLFPLITRMLEVGDYGVADVILTFASGTITLAVFAQPSALTTHFNDQPDEGWKRRITGSALMLSILLAVPLAIGLAVLSPTLLQESFGNQQYVYLLRWVAAGMIFGVSAAVLPAAAQAGLRVRWGIVLSVVTILTNTVGNLLFIVVLRLGVAGLVMTPILNSILVTLVGALLMRRNIGRPSLATMKLLFISGATLLPTLASGWILQMADRVFLLNYLTQDVAQSMGYYATANRVAALLGVVMTPLYAAWTPLALSIAHQPFAKERFASVARYLIGAALLAALGLGLFATEFLQVLARPSYVPAALYVGFLGYVHVFSAFGTILTTGALAAKQLKAVSLSVLAGAATNIVLNFVLIPSYGVWGATWATVLSYIVPQVLLYLRLRTHYPVPYPIGKLLAALGVQFVLLVIGVLLPPLFLPVRVLIKALLWAVLPAFLLISGFITPFEVEQARNFVSNQWSRWMGRVRPAS